jgi:hypothetical protein
MHKYILKVWDSPWGMHYNASHAFGSLKEYSFLKVEDAEKFCQKYYPGKYSFIIQGPELNCDWIGGGTNGMLESQIAELTEEDYK